MLSQLTFNVIDGGLGILPPNTGNLQVTLGVCSAGVPGTLYGVGSVQAILANCGWGPASEEVALKMQSGGGAQYLYCMPITNAGSLSAVTHSGPGYGVIAVSSGPGQQILITCTTTGALGTSAFTFAIGSGNASLPIVSAAGWSTAYQVLGTITNITLDAGTPNVGDTWTIATTGTVTAGGGNGGTLNVTQASSPFDQYEAAVQPVTTGAFSTGTFKYAMDYRVSNGVDISNYSAPIGIPSAGKYAIPNTGIVLTFTQPTILVKISTGGALGTGKIEVNVGGAGYGAEVPTVAGTTWSYAVPGTNTTITLATGVYVLNDVWTVSNIGVVTHSTGAGPGGVTQVSTSFVSGDLYTYLALPPTFSNTDIANAATALIADQAHVWSVAHVVNMPSTATAAATTATAADSTFATAGFAAYRFFRLFLDCPSLNSIVTVSSAPAYCTTATDSAIVSAFAAVLSVQGRTFVGAGDFDCISPLTGRFQRRCASWQLAMRAATTSLATDPGATKLGGLPFTRTIYRDEAQTPSLDAARIVTLRTYVQEPGFYVTAGPSMALITSDFSQLPGCRVIDAACVTTRSVLFPYLRDDVPVDPATGYILDATAKVIEGQGNSALSSTLVATQNASAARMTLSRTSNILSTQTEPVTVTVTPRGYLDEITINIGFVNPAIAAAGV